MYYILKSITMEWHNKALYASIMNDPFPEPEPPWWDGQPITSPLPELVFAVDSTAPLWDNYKTGTEFPLYSQRLVRLIESHGVRFETFPAKLIDEKSKSELTAHYEVFHLLEILPAIDRNRSVIEGRTIHKLVIGNEFLENPRPLFRLQSRTNLVIIHENLKLDFEAEGITGFTYTPVHEYVYPPPFPC